LSFVTKRGEFVGTALVAVRLSYKEPKEKNSNEHFPNEDN